MDIFEFVYAPLADTSANKWGVPKDIFSNLIRSESSFNPDAMNPSGAAGIGQFMPGTAAEMGIDPMNPGAALDAAAQYLRKNYEKYGSWRDAISQYKGYGKNLSAGYPRADAVLAGTGAQTGDIFDRAGVGSLEQITKGATGGTEPTLDGKAIWRYTLDDWKTFLGSSMLGITVGIIGLLIIVLSVMAIFKKPIILNKGI